MPYDEELAGRIRAALSFTVGVSEKRMFGGLGFLVDGHLVAAASHTGGVMLRLDPAEASELVNDSSVRYVRMNGRELAGWVSLDPSVVGEEEDLRAWLERGLSFVRGLAPG